MSVATAIRTTSEPRPSRGRALLVGSIVTFVAGLPTFFNRTDLPALENWGTIHLALVLQALPFLVLGVVVSAVLSTFVAPGAMARVVPRTTIVAVPVAALAAAALPGCECSSVPVAGRLVSRGVPPAAALTFLLAAPAINPIVLIATSVAFPGRPEMVAARFVASFLAATVVGLLWSRRRDASTLRFRGHEHTGTPAERFTSTVTHDFVQAGGFLVMGAAIVATIQTVVAPTTLQRLGGQGVVAVVLLSLAAFAMSLCSEADAFVAAGMAQFSPTARLAFLVVGPMVDVKLVLMQAGSFGRDFAVRFAPLTFVCAVASASLVGWVML